MAVEILKYKLYVLFKTLLLRIILWNVTRSPTTFGRNYFNICEKYYPTVTSTATSTTTLYLTATLLLSTHFETSVHKITSKNKYFVQINNLYYYINYSHLDNKYFKDEVLLNSVSSFSLAIVLLTKRRHVVLLDILRILIG